MIEFYYLLEKETDMGDRANFGIRQNDGNIIFVYGHWAGEGMLAKFANALDHVQNVGRIDDQAYANRIIISQLVGESWSGDLGWGVTVNYLADNEHKVPVYDFALREVTLYDYDWKSGVLTDMIVTFSLNEFIRKYAKTLVEV
jgi:hypothetical protein